jgi:hypothetical protein
VPLASQEMVMMNDIQTNDDGWKDRETLKGWRFEKKPGGLNRS